MIKMHVWLIYSKTRTKELIKNEKGIFVYGFALTVCYCPGDPGCALFFPSKSGSSAVSFCGKGKAVPEFRNIGITCKNRQEGVCHRRAGGGFFCSSQHHGA